MPLLNRILTPVACVVFLAFTTSAQNVLLDAEQFAAVGGWELDQQSMEQMGSPYLLAHGLGVPVKDAVTTTKFPAPGTYRVWVRTRDWVAPWKAPGAPGRFQLIIDRAPLPAMFGTEGAQWHWQDGGTVEIDSRGGQGTTVSFTLPLDRMSLTPLPPPEARLGGMVVPEGRP